MNNTVSNERLDPQQAYKKRKIRYAQMGMFVAWISALTVCTQGIGNGNATDVIVTHLDNTALVTIITSITLLAIMDCIAGVFSLIYLGITGRGPEIKRTFKLKVSWMLLLAAFAAGPVGTGLWMAAANFTGITITLCIVALLPIFTAIAGKFFLKENLSARVYLGIIIALAGVIYASWAPPEGLSEHFYLGIILACGAPIAFVVEGMCGTYASDLIDPIVGCGTYRTMGAGILGLITVTIFGLIVGDVGVVGQIIKYSFSDGYTLFWLIFAGLSGAISYITTYVGFNKCGPARTYAITTSTPIWSIPIGLLFSAFGVYNYVVYQQAVIGAIVVVAGVCIVVAKPSELFTLRNID